MIPGPITNTRATAGVGTVKNPKPLAYTDGLQSETLYPAARVSCRPGCG